MIKQKMFRLHRHKSSDKSGERFDFNFFNIQAVQVPKGWDKLYVSIISEETGKTTSKSGKSSVRNGNCRWTETLSESIWISQEDVSQELEQCLFKFLVSMGSARSSILGEVTVNLAGYMGSKASVPISLPLKKCNHGTILQVEIQCLTPRTILRNGKWKDSNSYMEGANVDYDDMDNKSDISDCSFTKSVRSSSSNNFSGTSHPGELGSRETISVSGSRPSFDSMEDSLGRESISSQSNLSGVVDNVIGRQDSTDSHNSASYGSYPVYESPRSNHLPYNSGISVSGKHLQSQREDFGRMSHAIATSPLRNAGASQIFLEAEDATIEELRAEARMWERNARKLMLDLEFLRKEFADQAKHMANLDMKLSASKTECDGLKQDIEHLQLLLEESMAKQKATEDLKLQAKDKDTIQKELKGEIRFQKESNDNLALQLKKTQESNLELVSVLQEMEETIEKQKMEIESLLTLKSKSDDTVPEYSYGHQDDGVVNPSEHVSVEKMRKASCDLKLDAGDVEPQLEQENIWNLELQLQELRESQKNLENTIFHLEKNMEDKNHEIEIERDLKTRTLFDCEAEWRHVLTVKEEEIVKLEAKLLKSLSAQDSNVTEFENGGDLDQNKEIKALNEKVQELERDCNELTDENLELLFKLKESKKNPSTGGAYNSSSNEGPADDSPSTESEVSKPKSQISQLKEKVKKEILLEGVVTDHLQIQCNGLESKCTNLELQLQAFKDKSYYLDGELQKCRAKAEEQEIVIAALQQRLESQQVEKTRNPTTQKDQAEAISDGLGQLNKSLEEKFSVCDNDLQCSQEKIRAGVTNFVQNIMEGENLEGNILSSSSRGLSSLNNELESTVEDLGKELLEKTSVIGELKADCLLNEEEIKALRCRQKVLETQTSDLQKIECQMEKNMEIMQREGSITSECLDNLENDMVGLSSSSDSYISANKILERKSLELESCKHELELNLSELEEENVHLSERIAGLEAQLRYLTDARESSRLEVQHSETNVMNLRDAIKRLENEMEVQKVDTRHKLQEMQKRWLEAQEECEYLKKANPKLQATTENLIEECNSLQKSNGELRQQRLELHKHCGVLEVELRESQNSFSECSEKIEALEAKFSSMLDEIATKDKILDSELDALLLQNKEHKEKLVMGESLLNQMYLEKAVEVENLQREVVHLSNQISATHEEREVRASEAVFEMHTLRADKSKMEAALQEVQGNFELTEKKLVTTRMECETKILDLMGELASARQNHEILVTKHDKLMGSLEDVRSSEEKLKGTVVNLESKLKSSEYETLQLAEEVSILKVQLQKIPMLQDEILALKSSFNEMKFENERLEASLQLVSGDYEELKAERDSLVKKIYGLQKVVPELEDYKRNKVSLEEKVMRLEGDLIAKEALCAQDAELKNEVGRIKRVNSQLQRKIKCLEEERQECLNKVQTLEEELKQKKGVKQNDTRTIPEEMKLSEEEKEDNTIQFSKDQQKTYMETDQLKQFSKCKDNQGMVQQQIQVNNKQYNYNESSQEIAIDIASRIQFLENGLTEALEANDMYKSQLKSVLSEVPLLEAELREIRERYLQMSLQYAEVESQREQLVLKLKTVNAGRKWFS